MPARVTLTGFNEFIQRLENEAEELIPKVDDELGETMNEAVRMAKELAPVGRTAALGGFISSSKNGQMDYSISAFAPYAAYVEFGTGVNVFKSLGGGTSFVFTPEIRAYAREFYVNGKGVQYPQPFFFVSIDASFQTFITRIKENVFNL